MVGRTDEWVESNAAVLGADELRDWLLALFSAQEMPSGDALLACDSLFLHREEAICRDNLKIQEAPDGGTDELHYLCVWVRKLTRDKVSPKAVPESLLRAALTLRWSPAGSSSDFATPSVGRAGTSSSAIWSPSSSSKVSSCPTSSPFWP